MGVIGFLWCVSNVFFVLFRRLRPESLLIVLSVWALYFLIRYWKRRELGSIFVATVLMSLGLFSHPNGLLLILTSGVVLCFDRSRFRVIGMMILAGLFSIFLYAWMWHMMQGTSLVACVQEMMSTDRTSLHGSLIQTFWTNVTSFVPAYTLGVKRAYLLMVEMGLLIAGVFFYKKDRVLFALSVMGCLYLGIGFLIFSPFFRAGFSIILIFSFLVMGMFLDRLPRVMGVLVVLYALNTLAGDVVFVRQNMCNTSYQKVASQIEAMVPPGATVLTHLQFWFPLKNTHFYTQFTRWQKTPYGTFEGFCRSGHIDYVVLTDVFSGVTSPTTGTRHLVTGSAETAFYSRASELVKTAALVGSIETVGYGKIFVYRLRS
jgi:hypothetical protein